MCCRGGLGVPGFRSLLERALLPFIALGGEVGVPGQRSLLKRSFLPLFAQV